MGYDLGGHGTVILPRRRQSQIRATVGCMRAMVRQSVSNPQFPSCAAHVVNEAHRLLVDNARERDTQSQIATVVAFVRRVWYFVDDPIDLDDDGIELLKWPAELLHEWRHTGRMSGDCDDAALMCATLLCAVGIRSNLTTVAWEDPEGDDEPFAHVLTEAFDGEQWHALDVTQPKDPYWTPSPIARVDNYEVAPMGYPRSGLGQGVAFVAPHVFTAPTRPPAARPAPPPARRVAPLPPARGPIPPSMTKFVPVIPQPIHPAGAPVHPGLPVRIPANLGPTDQGYAPPKMPVFTANPPPPPPPATAGGGGGTAAVVPASGGGAGGDGGGPPAPATDGTSSGLPWGKILIGVGVVALVVYLTSHG